MGETPSSPPNFAANHLTYGFQAELLLLRRPPLFLLWWACRLRRHGICHFPHT